MFRPVMTPPKHEKAPPGSRLISAGAPPLNSLNCLESRSASYTRFGLALNMTSCRIALAIGILLVCDSDKFGRRREAGRHRAPLTPRRREPIDRQLSGTAKDDQHNLLVMLSIWRHPLTSGLGLGLGFRLGALTSPLSRTGGSIALPTQPSPGDQSENRSQCSKAIQIQPYEIRGLASLQFD